MSHLNLDKITSEDIKKIDEAFDEPINIQIMFKVMKNPNISSKELKDALFLKGSKIYYYLNYLEEVWHEEKSFLISEETHDLVRKHLKVKKFTINPWFKNLLNSDQFINLYESEEETKRWHRIIFLKISISLLSLQLREFMEGTPEEVNKKISNLPGFELMFMTKESSKFFKNKMQGIFQELCALEEQQLPIYDLISKSDFSIILGSVKNF